MVISASLQACGVVFPFAMLTSICRSIVTICSGLYLFIGMTASPPNGFSLIPLGTKTAGHVKATSFFDPDSRNTRHSLVPLYLDHRSVLIDQIRSIPRPFVLLIITDVTSLGVRT